MPSEDTVSLQVALLGLAHKCYPSRVDYIDKVLLNTSTIFDKLQITKYVGFLYVFTIFKIIDLTRFDCRIEYNTNVWKELMRLLKLPVDHYKDILTVIQLENYAPLLDYLDYAGRKTIAVYLITSVLDNGTLISTQEQAIILFEAFQCMIFSDF